MGPEIIGVFGICILLTLLLLGMGIGFAMALVGFAGFAYLSGLKAALGVIATVPYSSVAHYGVSVVPLFLFMGSVASKAEVSSDLYKAAYKWLGHFPGGLAMATIGACSAFAAICGSSIAAAATIGKVVLPEMKKYNYDPKLATGTVAAGGTLGILIPPSIGFIVYGILTQEPVGKLFVAGIIPGLLLSALFMIQLFIQCRMKPELGPPGPKCTLKEKVLSLRFAWSVLALFLLVIGGIYFGIFTPTEAGAVGAFGMILIGLLGKRLTWKKMLEALMETTEITAMVFVLLIGAMIFTRFLSISKLSFAISEFVQNLSIPSFLFLSLIVGIYLVIGMFMEILSSLALTLPLVYPAVVAMGFDPIWFGVVIVILCEMGLVTPPVGMNLFVISGVSGENINVISRGAFPFVITMLIAIIIVSIFPDLALFLPSRMR